MAKRKKSNPVNPNLHPDQLRSAAETAYGTGERAMPPMFHEMSPETQTAVAAGFRNSMSNWKTRETEAAAKGNKGALTPQQLARLKDTDVTIEQAGKNIVTHWRRMMRSSDRPEPAWYFGHNRRLTDLATKRGMDPNIVIDASGAMSPQNDPDSEYKAAVAMSDAVVNRRQIRAVNDVYEVLSDKQKEQGVEPRLIMKAGERRTISSMTPEEMQHATATANAKNVAHAPDFNLAGFRNAGTNRQRGFRTLNEPDYNAVEEMKATKVHMYTGATKASIPDSPLHHEYGARFEDQDEARRVRLARAADKRSGLGDNDLVSGRDVFGKETPIWGSSAKLHGVMDRVDLYGLMKGGDDPTDPAYHHPILGTKGYAVPDTWISAILSGQEIHDLPDSSSPAKAAGSRTQSTHAKISGHTLMPPAAAKAAGGKELTGGAAWGMAAVAAIQHGATLAREKESQTNIPPVMMQEMPWVHVRGRVAEGVEEMLKSEQFTGSEVATRASRVGRLTGGTLEGFKEFRGAEERAPQVTRIETPGMFSRGYNNPLDTDAVSIVTSTGRPGSQPTPVRGLSRAASKREAQAPRTGMISTPDMSQFTQTTGPSDDELAKRRIIHEAHRQYAASRAGGGAAWHGEKP